MTWDNRFKSVFNRNILFMFYNGSVSLASKGCSRWPGKFKILFHPHADVSFCVPVKVCNDYTVFHLSTVLPSYLCTCSSQFLESFLPFPGSLLLTEPFPDLPGWLRSRPSIYVLVLIDSQSTTYSSSNVTSHNFNCLAICVIIWLMLVFLTSTYAPRDISVVFPNCPRLIGL